MDTLKTDVLVVGAGSVGIAAAYYLKQLRPGLQVTLVDIVAPLSFTSAQSGENYRNWWPHPVMKQFMDRSIELMEGIAESTGNRIQMSRGGYLLASRRASPKAILDNLAETYTETDALRFQTGGNAYARSLSTANANKSDGVDVLTSTDQIQALYPYFDKKIQSVIHIRRGGQLSVQQLGSFMLEVFKEQNGKVMNAEVTEIQDCGSFIVQATSPSGPTIIETAAVVNAAGPFADRLARMVSVGLPVTNVLQQKIAFEDTRAAIDRKMPFAIDLDSQKINWTAEEREAMAVEPSLKWLLNTMPGSIHCRPEGHNWIKLGWAYNNNPATAARNPILDDHFPEIVLRGASRLLPSLAAYFDGFPRNFSHYGGYYTLTEENWPLIGESGKPGFDVVTAMSGFGSMAACAAGELIARKIANSELPGYAAGLSLQRYNDKKLMREISAMQSRGIL